MARPAGRGELDSLYFTYPRFEAPERPEGRALPTEAPVAVVGAGPVGMTAALALAKAGVSSVMFDDKATFNDGSRAICIARPSFYIFERLGAAAPFLGKALGWTTGRSFYRGEQILEFHMPDGPDEKFRPMYNLQQQYIEQFLWRAVAAEPRIETRWRSAVTGAKDIPGGVRLAVSDPQGGYSLDFPWVLACDGARSPLRKLRGLRLKGENFEGRYVIADVRMRSSYPTIRRALFDPACRPGGTVLIHRQPEDIWRIDYQLRPDEPTEAAMAEGAVRASVEAVLAEIGHDGPWDLEWWSVYSANTLALDDYRDGRVFFVGDSAHIVPIFGVRGLNNGLADATDIGWKLGWVLTGRAGETLLDSYTPERRGATLDVFANASKSARFMTPSTPGWRLMRDAALSLALTHRFAGELANPRQMTAYAYPQSSAILADDPAFAVGPPPGSVLPEVRVAGDFLSDQLGAGFTLLCFDPDLAEAIEAKDPSIMVRRFPPDSEVARRLGAAPTSAYLIRPDLYIAGRWFEAEAEVILSKLKTLLFGERR